VIEPHALELGADKPDAQHTGDFVVVENIGVDGVDRHDGSAGSEHHEIARFENGHW